MGNFIKGASAPFCPTWRELMEIKATGMNQDDLVTLLTNIITMCNELKTDFNAALAMLDADSVGSADYVATVPVTTTDLTLDV